MMPIWLSQGTNNFGSISAASSLIVLLGVLSARLLLHKNKQQKQRLPPVCTAGLLTTIRQLGSTDAPWFLYYEMLKLKSKVYRIYFPGQGYIWIVNDYQLQRKVLTHPSCDKPVELYNVTNPVSGGCAQIVSRSTFDVKWKQIRKSAAHAFSSNEVKRMNTICTAHVNTWLEQVIDLPLQQNNNDGVCIDPSVEMTRITFGSIVQSAFEYQPTDEEFHKIHAAIDCAMLEYAIRRPINPFRALFSWFIQDSRNANVAIDVIGNFCQKLLDTHRANNRKDNDTMQASNKTLIQIIESSDVLSDKEKVAEIIAFLVAGHDTTSYTLSTILCLLAQYPDEQAKVRASFNTTSRQAALTDALQNVMLEARRLLPVAAVVSVRKLLQDVPDDTWGTIPAGMSMYLPQLSTQRDANVYEDPDEFRPDRWIAPTQAMKDCLLSFSLGNRNCVGQSLANAELNSILSKLLSTYTFTLVEKGRLENLLTMKYQGCILRVTKNNYT